MRRINKNCRMKKLLYTELSYTKDYWNIKNSEQNT